MFKLCSGSSRMLLGRLRRMALGFRLQYSLLRILIPSHRTRRVCPAMFRFKEAYCGIQSEPVTIWRMCSESLRVNLVEHDVYMKMLFVVVRDDHILVVSVSECFQCVQRSVCPLWSSRTFSWRPCQFIVA